MKHPTDARSATVRRLAIALMASASVAVAACSGSSTSSPSATPSPTATASLSVISSPGATSAGAVDPCLVGTWTTVPLSENSPANDEQITYSGGAGEVFTIDPKGEVTIDTRAAQKVVFVSAGQTFSAVVAGTGHGTLSTRIAGTTRFFDFEPSDADTRTTHSFDSSGVELGPARPDTAFTAVYTCTPGKSFTFYNTAVNFMIDGPKVTLSAGNTGSSTAGPTSS